MERIRRRKPDWDEEETRVYSPRLDVRQTRVPSLPTPKPQLEWPAFRRLVEDWGESTQRPILQMFIANNGPASVARGIKEALEAIRHKGGNSGEIYSDIRIDAYGTTFERLACYWLKIETEEHRRVLDVGSTQRVAHTFRRTSGIHIMPDGLIINDSYHPPLLEAVCEYKTNPTDPDSREQLNRQLEQFVSFFTKLGDKTLQAREKDKFDLDRRSHWSVREIRIAARPSVILVIPEDRFYEPPNEFVEVRKASFTSVNLSRIVHVLLDDSNGMGLIDQELALFEERHQQELGEPLMI